MILIRKYTVIGRVQGVGFRAFVRQTARRLLVRGTVRNLPDGSVECIVCAAASADVNDARTATASDSGSLLGEFEAQLRKGPPHSAVDAVYSEELPVNVARRLPTGFEII